MYNQWETGKQYIIVASDLAGTVHGYRDHYQACVMVTLYAHLVYTGYITQMPIMSW